MSKSSPKLQWVKVRLGEDFNWWVQETSDPIHWDVDGLGIIDPRQASNLTDSLDSIREYGFDPEVFESAFFAFRIVAKDGDLVELRRVQESFLELEEELFLLPDVVDEEKSPYADFLDQITRYRVKLLNDLIDLNEKLEVDEIEESIREDQNKDYMEGKAVHFFDEVSAILDFVPAGYELEEDDDDDDDDDEDVDIDIPDFDEDTDEKIEVDETMKWDEDEEFEDGEKKEGEEQKEEAPEPPKRGRPRKKD